MPTSPFSPSFPRSRTVFVCSMLLGLLTISGCRNSCQELCEEMAAFSAEECNKEFPDEQLDECINAYDKDNVDEEQEEVCASITPTLREEWTCDEVADYFDKGGSEPTDDATTE